VARRNVGMASCRTLGETYPPWLDHVGGTYGTGLSLVAEVVVIASKSPAATPSAKVQLAPLRR